MKNSSIPKTRLIMPEIRAKAELKLTEISAESVLDDALNTAAIEVTRYRTKVARGDMLDLKEARVVHGWISAMLDIMREQREQVRAANFEKLSDEEMYTLARKVLNEGNSIIPTNETPKAAKPENEED